MTRSTSVASGSQQSVALRIADRAHPSGPVTRARLRRTFAPIVAGWILGLGLVAADASPGWQAFGLGLVLPGGGFWYTGHPLLAIASVVALALSIIGWWGLGPVLLVPTVYLGSAALGSTRTSDGIWPSARGGVPLALGVCVLGWLVFSQLTFRRARARGRARNEQLAGVSFAVPGPPVSPAVTESSAEDLAALRYALDLALQPVDRWDGFHVADQFREAALRYQLQFLGYALSTAQYTRTPAFNGYLAEAQRNAIDKSLDPRVWRYWRWENLWGNLRWDPDPVRRDNVMLSGYYAVQVGLYESVTGDDCYSQPDALTFQSRERQTYRYDLPKLAEVMHTNLAADAFGMFPCEPNWIYPFCNTFAINTLVLHDRLHDADLSSDAIDAFKERFDLDFTRADGRVIGIRNHYGFNIPSTVTVSDAVLAYWLNAALPDLALRTWWLMRQSVVRPEDPNPFPAMHGFDFIDPGNYKVGNDTFSRSAVYLAAVEMGDDEAAAIARSTIEDRARAETANGVRWYPELSVYANLQHTLARFGRAGSMREMIAFDRPEAWRSGPVLADAAYPDVLVARAVTDGSCLDLVLRPGDGPRRVALTLGRLRPEQRYEVTGAIDQECEASAEGTAIVHVDLGDRTEIRVRPLS